MSFKWPLHNNVAGWYIRCQLIDSLHIWNRDFYNWSGSGLANQHIQVLDNQLWGRVRSTVRSSENIFVLVFSCTANYVPDVTMIYLHLWWSCLVVALSGCLSKELRWKCNGKRLKISFIIITTMATMRCLFLYWISSTLLWKLNFCLKLRFQTELMLPCSFLSLS